MVIEFHTHTSIFYISCRKDQIAHKKWSKIVSKILSKKLSEISKIISEIYLDRTDSLKIE